METNGEVPNSGIEMRHICCICTIMTLTNRHEDAVLGKDNGATEKEPDI